jgi:hypothetical protein
MKKMLEFLIDNIYVVVGGQVFEQSVEIPMGTNCAPLLADLFLYLYEAKIIQKFLHEKNKSSAVAFNSTFRCIDYVLFITTFDSTHMSIRYIPMSWKSKTTQSAPHLLRI